MLVDMIHMFPGLTVLLKEGAHIGHIATIHGATIGKNCLLVGNPARKIREVTDEMIAWKTAGTTLYQTWQSISGK